MAIIYKRNAPAAPTDISVATAWDSTSPAGAGPPTTPWPPTADVGYFTTTGGGTSIAGVMTGSLSIGGFFCNINLATAPTFQTGTITLGSSGLVHTTANDDAWTFSGGLDIIANQPWTLYRATAPATAVNAMVLSGALTSSAGGFPVITMTSAGANYAVLSTTSTTSTFDGFLILNNLCRFNIASATVSTANGLGAGARIQTNSTNNTAFITSSVASGYVPSDVIVNTAGTSLGIGGGTGYASSVILAGNIYVATTLFGSTAAGTLSGAITIQTIPSDQAQIQSSNTSASGSITISGTVNFSSGSTSVQSLLLTSNIAPLTISGTLNGVASTTYNGWTINGSGASTLTVSGTLNGGSAQVAYVTAGQRGPNQIKANLSTVNVTGPINCQTSRMRIWVDGTSAGGTGTITISNTIDATSATELVFGIEGTGNIATTTGDITVSGATNCGTLTPRFFTNGAATGLITVSGAISGTGGILRDNSQSLTQLILSNTAGNVGLTGTITNSSGDLILGAGKTASGTGNTLANGNAITMASGTTLYPSSTVAYTFPNTVSGLGSVLFQNTAAYSPSAGTGGVLVPAATVSGIASAGAYATGAVTSHVRMVDAFPTEFRWLLDGAGPTANIYWKNTAGGGGTDTFSGVTDLENGTGTGTITAAFFNDNPDAGAAAVRNINIAGNVTRTNAAGTVIFALGATQVFSALTANIVSGIIENPIGVTAVTVRSTNLSQSTTLPGYGKWALTAANTYAGATTVTSGHLIITNAGALGSSAANTAITLQATAITVGVTTTTYSPILDLDQIAGMTINKSLAALSMTGTATAPAILRNSNGNNTFTLASVTTSTYYKVEINNDSLTILGFPNANTTTRSQWSGAGGGSLTLTITSSAITAGSPVDLDNLTVVFPKISNSAVTSSFGNQGTAVATVGVSVSGRRNCDFTIDNATTLRHTGTTADTSDRRFYKTLGSTLRIDSSGTGSANLYFTGTITTYNAGTSSANHLILGGTNPNPNTYIGDISGTATAPINIFKYDTNEWRILGALTNNGTLQVDGGTLNLGSALRTFTTLTMISGTLTSTTTYYVTATTTTLSGGTITSVLAGANTVTVTTSATTASPATLAPDDSTDGNNTFTGNVTVNGCVDLLVPDGVQVSTAGKGRVLGASNTVTVSSTGTIRTGNSSNFTQRGQARYNNLTLQSGSTMMIGFA